MTGRKFFVGGNFKMNGTSESIKKIAENMNSAKLNSNVEVVLAPPAPYLSGLNALARGQFKVAAQNAHEKASGAFTGEVSVQQLKDLGIEWVILGHSERRTIYHESDELVADKTHFALENGVSVILCIGEQLEQRESGKTHEVVTKQLDKVHAKVKDWSHIVIAYEPVWAIGTGKVATPEQAQQVHAEIRRWVAKNLSQQAADSMRIIYGGSVAAKNSKELAQQNDIDGFLVGGASLKPEFVDIVNSNES